VWRFQYLFNQVENNEIHFLRSRQVCPCCGLRTFEKFLNLQDLPFRPFQCSATSESFFSTYAQKSRFVILKVCSLTFLSHFHPEEMLFRWLINISAVHKFFFSKKKFERFLFLFWLTKHALRRNSNLVSKWGSEKIDIKKDEWKTESFFFVSWVWEEFEEKSWETKKLKLTTLKKYFEVC